MKLLILLFLSFNSFALEIDEKLTTRFLSVSSTKKTVLINRGLEDGLVIGDHAKFFLTIGVIARGVVVKASPRRSIWSLYRLIDNSKIVVDKVVNIKISTPLKLTEDATRSLVYEPVVSGTESISISRGDPDNMKITGAEKNSSVERDDLAALESNRSMNEVESNSSSSTKALTHYSRGKYVRNLDSISTSVGSGRGVFSTNRSLEAVGRFQWNSYKTTFDNGIEGSSLLEGSDSTMSFGASLEKYFPKSRTWLRSFSFFGTIDYASNTTETQEEVTEGGEKVLKTVETKTSDLTIGIGSNWHFYNDILSIQAPIGFVSAALGLVNSTGTVGDAETKGSGTFFSLGVGVKYYTVSGFGVRGSIDYYSQGIKTTRSNTDVENVTTKSGPRLLVGASYLF